MGKTKRRYRLLIVDDDATDRRVYRRLLTRDAAQEFEITEAASGAAALAALSGAAFDCLLLDFNLPDMSGLAFLRAAAADRALETAVVLVTGQGNEAIAVEAMKQGAQDYLVKDQLDAQRLVRAIAQAVTEKQLDLRLAATLRDLTAANAALQQEIERRAAVEQALRAAKDAAEQASRAKTRFVAMITHELRTPLNGLFGYAQMLHLEGGLSAQQQSRVEAMTAAGRHLLQMVEQVLDFATIEQGRLSLQPAQVKLSTLLEGCIGVIGPAARAQGLSVRLLQAYDAPREIAADPARLRQVVLNLLGNAVKFTQAGSVELRVLAGATEQGVRIEVADTGPGIAEEAVARLFQDFERLDAGGSVEGTGLGLAISSRIVSLMGGVIGHEPAPHGGSVFWFEIPTAALAASGLPGVGSLPTPWVAAARVLLVDDIAMNRDVIGAFLRAAGHQATLADGGARAVACAAEQDFDLILMDVRMPDIDGIEATRRIRALPGPRGRVPILALSAYSFPEHVAQCREVGMDGHVSKPVDYQTLITAIAQAVRSGPPAPPLPPVWRLRPKTILPQAEAGLARPFTPDAAADDPQAGEAEANGRSPARLDRGVLEQTLEILAREDVPATLAALRQRKQQMLRELDAPVPAAQVAGTAHTLAAAAGMFGFTALSVIGRRLERAIQRDSPETPVLSQQMRQETTAALAALEELLRDQKAEAA